MITNDDSADIIRRRREAREKTEADRLVANARREEQREHDMPPVMTLMRVNGGVAPYRAPTNTIFVPLNRAQEQELRGHNAIRDLKLDELALWEQQQAQIRSAGGLAGADDIVA